MIRPTIEFTCGPQHDLQKFKIGLPLPLRLGVLVSGGIDSAILYWILNYLNSQHGWKHTIKPFTIHRREGSPVHAPMVIDYVNNYFSINNKITIVGNNTLPEPQQVASGVREVFESHLANVLYLGNIKMFPEHAVGWSIPKIQDTHMVRSPMLHLNKSHVLDLVIRCNQPELFKITHSCIHSSGRCYKCNGCNERSWGFEQLGITDPGSV